jgi:hypothetical protein
MKTCRRKTCNPDDCCGAVVVVKWLGHDREVPEGWERAEHAASHHSQYRNLIRRAAE